MFVAGPCSVAVCAVLKDGVYFTTEGSHGLKALGRRIKEAEAAYEEKQKALVANAVDVARSYTPVLEMAAALISELDAFNGLAQVATGAPVPYVRPEVVDGNGGIELRGARHPVMEFQENMTFIPNDYKYVGVLFVRVPSVREAY